MEYKSAIVQEIDSEIKLFLSEFEKPEMYQLGLQKSYDDAVSVWKQSFKEYPIRDTDEFETEALKAWFDKSGNYQDERKTETFVVGLSKGIQIDHTKVGLICKHCLMDVENHRKIVGCAKYTEPSYHAVIIKTDKETDDDIEFQQNELWKEANRLYNIKNHTQDGRDLQMKNFIIKRR